MRIPVFGIQFAKFRLVFEAWIKSYAIVLQKNLLFFTILITCDQLLCFIICQCNFK